MPKTKKKVVSRAKKSGKKVAKVVRRATVFKTSSWYETAARSIGISTSGRYPIRRETASAGA